MTEPTDPIRQQFVEARRAQILAGAARVFANKGFHSATNKDIAEAAGIAYGTIYNYFGSKADLLVGILNRLDEIEQRGEQMEAALQLDFQTAFSAFLQRHTAQYLPNLDMFKAILPEVLVNPELRQLYYQQNVLPTRQLLAEHIQARMERGELRPADAPLVARTLTALLLGSMVLHILGDEIPDGDTIPAQLADMLLNGLRAQAE